MTKRDTVETFGVKVQVVSEEESERAEAVICALATVPLYAADTELVERLLWTDWLLCLVPGLPRPEHVGTLRNAIGHRAHRLPRRLHLGTHDL